MCRHELLETIVCACHSEPGLNMLSRIKRAPGPSGFWEPIGLTADGDVDTFKRWRATQLLHEQMSLTTKKL